MHVSPHVTNKAIAWNYCSSLLLASLLWANTSFAEASSTSPEEKAAARNLAIEGIRLARAGDCQEALNKLNRAEALFHAPTILTWIGQCQIQVGHLVEGTETLHQVIREKTGPDAPDAYLHAQEKAATLLEDTWPRIAKLTIMVDQNELEGLVISIGEKTLSNALIGAPRPTDPGTHSVTVEAPGYFSTTKEVKLDDGAEETLRFSLTAVPRESPKQDTSLEERERESSTQRRTPWVAWTTVGLGGAFTAAGGVTGYLALTKKNGLSCDTPTSCDSSQQDTLDAANLNATLSTVFFGVGGAALVTGVVLLIIDKPGLDTEVTTTKVQPTFGIGSVGISGFF